MEKGDVVKVNQIVGINVPLPAVGTINRRTVPNWYSVKIKWREHISEVCPTCGHVSDRKVERERDCDVREDWMEFTFPDSML